MKYVKCSRCKSPQSTEYKFIHNQRKRQASKAMTAVLTAALMVLAANAPVYAAAPGGNPATYTLDTHFDEGSLINVNHDAPNNDQLQLKDTGEAFDFIWVAASARGTVVKIDTLTGQILGEYQSAPDNRGRNPSRTTVDANGNVWAGNRNEAADGRGSIVHVGLEENGQCDDRNGNGTIETSSGLGDIKPWSNTGNADDNGGVSTALDECIIHYVRTAGTNVRTVAIDGSNNVWVGGLGNRVHELYNGATGLAVPASQFDLGCGGYGGLVDGNGVLWSASLSSALLRYDPVTSTGACIALGRASYGLGIDTNGHIWNSNWTSNTILKIDPSGAPIMGPFGTGGAGGDRGVAVTPADNNVWVANSGGSDVSRLDNNGAFITAIAVGSTPTGLSVDAAGKVWVTNLGSNSAMRIDPATNLVDLTVDLGAGAGPYNYSDMTGSTITAPPDSGTWNVIHDSGIVDAVWRKVSWTASEPGDASISVTVASSADGITFGPAQVAVNGSDPGVADGRYIKVIASFARSTNADANGDGVFDGPILYDLSLLTNQPPECTGAYPSSDLLWPPNHKFAAISVLGVTDPDGDAVSLVIDSIFQDEPVDAAGDGHTTPDGQGVGTDTAAVRAERSGSKKVPGDGRVYHIGFTAEDVHGGTCSGEVLVGVPHDQGKGKTPVDGGALYDSTTP